MKPGFNFQGLELTEEEAFSLLELALTSPQKLDSISENAIHKLADYCRTFEEGKRSQLRHLEAAG